MTRLNQTLLVAAGLFVLSACSQKEPVAIEEPVPIVDETEVEAEVPPPVENSPTDDDTLEVVEESAAEPEDTGEAEILLARAEPPAAPVKWQFKEGVHYHRLVPSQPTVGGADKIEVAEIFWYGCPHCFDLEPTINRWDENKPANVRFVKVPAMWNDVLKFHAQLFYTEEELVRNGQIKDANGFRNAVFEEYHRRGNRLLSEAAVAKLFGRFGVDQETFDKTWGSFEVAHKLNVAADLTRRYSIASVPAIVVNGKYRTGAAEAGSYPELIDVIDELIARESLR